MKRKIYRPNYLLRVFVLSQVVFVVFSILGATPLILSDLYWKRSIDWADYFDRFLLVAPLYQIAGWLAAYVTYRSAQE